MIQPATSRLSRVFARPPYDLVLSQAEEEALIPRGRAGDRQASRRLYLANARAYVVAAQKQKASAARYGIEVDELIAEAVMDFPGALVGYDPARGARFGAYLYSRSAYLMGSYIREVGPVIRVPRLRDGSSPHAVQCALNALGAVSLDALLEECPYLEPGAPDEEEVPEAPETAQSIRAVRRALKSLSPVQREIVALFYGFHGPREDSAAIARKLGVSKGTVSKTVATAKERLFPDLAAKSPLRGDAILPPALASMYNAVTGYAQ